MFTIFRKLAGRISRLLGAASKGESDDKYQYSPEMVARAEAGDPLTQTALATAYHEGLGVDQNPALAFHWFLAAAKQGHAGAQLMIAAAYDIGKHVERDPIEAAHWAALSKAGGNELGDVFFASVTSKMSEAERRRVAALLKQRHPDAF